MADGYELDYKKVHNTLGKPKKNKYGNELGQYVTNLAPIQGINASSNPYDSGIVEVYEGLVGIETGGFIGTCKILAGDDNGRWYDFAAKRYYENNTWSDIQSSWADGHNDYHQTITDSCTIQIPSLGFEDVTGNQVRISKWGIWYTDNAVYSRNHSPIIYQTEKPVAIDISEQVVALLSSSQIITLSTIIAEMLSDEEAWNIIKNKKPIVLKARLSFLDYVYVGLPNECLTLSFQLWMRYNNYNLALILVRDYGSIKHHYYYKNNTLIQTDKRYTILRNIRFGDSPSQALCMPMPCEFVYGEETVSPISRTFNLSASKSSVLNTLTNRNGHKWTGEYTHALKYAQLCDTYEMDNSNEVITVCFALYPIKKSTTRDNCLANGNGKVVISQDESYYSGSTIKIPRLT